MVFLKPVAVVKCNHVSAQITLGYYDAEGNLVAEEAFPQTQGTGLTARLYYPYAEELSSLIDLCIDQAREKLEGAGALATPALTENGGKPARVRAGVEDNE
jgi:hypothetical protein